MHQIGVLICIVCMIGCFNAPVFAAKNVNLFVVTVASNNTDGFQRFMRSANLYGHKVEVLGMGQPWRGGDVKRYAGGGYKISLLKKFLKPFKDDKEKLILFTDSYDAVMNGAASDIVKRFKKSASTRIFFSAESYCWPDATLAEQYPMVSGPYRYLNSGGFIGYASDLYELVTFKDIKDLDDDQAYFTELFLDDNIRAKLKIKLDTTCTLFQNLNGAEGEVGVKSLDEAGDDSHVQNTIHGTNPLIIHGNGAAKFAINAIGNYIAKSWTTAKGCLACKENHIDVDKNGPAALPDIIMGIFIEKPTPFIDQFFDRLVKLNYPKNKINLRIHNIVPYHVKHVRNFLNRLEGSSSDVVKENEIKIAGEKVVQQQLVYKSVQLLGTVPEESEKKSEKKSKDEDALKPEKEKPKQDQSLSESAARERIINECKEKRCAYFMSIDSDAQLTNPDTLQLLIAQNRTILAPMLKRHNALYANFWGALSNTGYYARSDDYLDIAESRKTGIWNVPYISSAYLIRGDYILHEDFGSTWWATNAVERTAHAAAGGVSGSVDATPPTTDSDILFCYHARNAGYFMYVTNQHYYGHLLNMENYASSLALSGVAPDLYQIADNQLEWEHAYIHEQYNSHVVNKSVALDMPCPDAYIFPLVSERYCSDLIAVMEGFGRWSTGTNDDTRLAGGYENVPTRDIHMNQVNFDKQWLFFLREYVRPVQEKLYTGYYHDPPTAIMNFVVRYKPDEQPFLRPHHDASTYTINIALNRATEDYEGGGCRFLRYNCTVANMQRGWTLMHPGRLTHYHEGLYTTKGTRYIQVSFVDP